MTLLTKLNKINAILQSFNYNDLGRIRKRIPKKGLQAFDDMVTVMEENFKGRWDIGIVSTLNMQVKSHTNVYGYYYGYEYQMLPLWHWERDWRAYEDSPYLNRRKIAKSNTTIQPYDISEYIMPPIKATKLEIKILYPKLTIRNSKKLSRELLDMVIRLELTYGNSNWTITAFGGGRLTYTSTEYLAGYVHSHLARLGLFENAQNSIKFSSFCTGGDSVKMLEMQFSAENSLENFEAFILMIQPYLEWESLEGGPYVCLDNTFVANEIDINSPKIVVYGNAKTLFSALWTEITNRFREPDPEFMGLLKWELTSSGYRIKETDELLAYYKKKIPRSCHVVVGEGNKLYEYKDAMSETTVSISAINLRAPFLKWRGGTIRVRVVDDYPDSFRNIPEEKIIVHPLIVKYVNSKFEAVINNKITDEIANRKIRENRDTKVNSTQDNILMQGNTQR